MAASKGVWGIDLGQSALRALKLELIDGVPTATAFDYVEHPKILSQPDADPEQLTREALDQFLSRNKIKGDLVAIAVPGQSGLARFVKLPPVEEKKIGDIVKFEAKQQIPFPLEEVVWDYQKIGAGEVTDGFAMETEIGLFAMKRDQLNRALAHFKDAGIEVHYIQMSPLALCNYLTYDFLNKGGTPPANAPAEEPVRGKKQCVVGLDIGTDSSNMVVTDGDKVIWQRPIPIGGNHLSRALSKDLKLTFAKAEHLKRNAAKSPTDLKQILAALKPVLGDFVSEVQRSLGFFTNSHRDAQVSYMVGVGSAFRLPGFQKYLSEKLQLDVRKPTQFNRLVGEEVTNSPVFQENLLSFAIPYGLAIQGLGQSKLTTNLLPQEIRFDRMIRAKKPWAVAAASALFLGTGILAGGYAMNYNSVAASSIKSEIQKADGEIKKAGDQNAQAKTKEDDIARLTADVKSVIAGKEEQLNWIRLNEYINRCLPNPESPGKGYDGGNLKSMTRTQSDPTRRIDQTVYWNNQPAAEAWREYSQRVRGGQSADIPLDEKIRENLVLVDIEGVDARFCDNLKTFFDRAKESSKMVSGSELRGMLKYDFDNPPKDGDKGWVVELRGSTYHKQSINFLTDTLVHNLTFQSRKTLPEKGEAAAGGAGGAPATPAGTPPAGSPPAAAAAPTGGTEANVKRDPIDDAVSHVFVYSYWPDPDSKPGTFKYINASISPSLISAGAAGAAGGGPGGGAPVGEGSSGGAAGVSGRDGWAPLTSSTASGGNAGFAMGEGAAPSPGLGGRPGGGRPGLGGLGGGVPSSSAGMPALPGAGGLSTGGGSPRGPSAFGGIGSGEGGTPNPATANRKIYPRYEFVIMFVWKEPTPSDALMKLDQPAK